MQSKTKATATATAPKAVALPAANIVAMGNGRTVTIAAIVGTTYAIAATVNGTTTVLPFTLPAWAGKAGAAITVAVAKVAPYWLGRDAQAMQLHLCYSPMGVVAIRHHSAGKVVANAYPANHPKQGQGITACNLPAVAPAAAAAATAAKA